MSDASPEQLARLASFLEARVGFRLDREHAGQLQLALRERVPPPRDPARIDAYLDRLLLDPGELRLLLPLVTIGKTSFFRDEGQFAALRLLLPDLLAGIRREGRRLSIWSAGCSSGEETYSLAVELLEAGARREEVELLGTDVNAEAIAACRGARFRTETSLPIPRELLLRHFEREGEWFLPRPDLRGLARFQIHNLNDDEIPLPASGAWDIVFCRNVLIYFTGPALRRAIRRIHDGMRPGGWLFLGYSESLFRVSEAFDLLAVGDSFLYRRPDRSKDASHAEVEDTDEARLPPIVGTRIEASIAEAEHRRPSPIPERPSPRHLLRQAIVRMQEGAFDAARAILETSLGTYPRDVGARLTLAHLCVILREPEQARASYEEALALDEICAESHLFYAMHLMEQGELERAEQSLTRAIFLEPRLPLAHFFMGRCQERMGDAVAARRAYRNAIGAVRQGQAFSRFLSYYPDLPDDGDTVARAAQLALAGL